MNRVLIIEDEAPARERLVKLVEGYERPLSISGTTEGVEDSIRWLEANGAPDLILLDIQLTDGLSTEIFKKFPLQCPVIFITAFDTFLVEAFEYHCLDYVLKPVNKERLHQALYKYFKVRAHYEGRLAELVQRLSGDKPDAYTGRILVRKGLDQFSVKIVEVAYFYTEHKVVFAVTRNGERYLTDKTLTGLQEELDPHDFFRVNRKYLVHTDGIHSLRPFGKGRLRVQLNPGREEEIIVSQSNANAFKSWLEN